MTRLLRACSRLAAGAALVAAVVVAGPAQAHTELVRSTPADGAKLGRLPDQAVLTFDEIVVPADVTVRAAGRSLPVQASPGDQRAVWVDLRPVRSTARVALSWRVVDAHDGHESSGTITVRVVARDGASTASDAGPAASPPDDRLVRWAEVSARTTGYLALAILIGGLLFVSLIWPAGADERRTRILLSGAVAAGAAAAAAEIAIVMWRAGGAMTLTATLDQDFGRVYAAMTLLWLLAAVVVVSVLQGGEDVVRRPPWRVGALVVAFGLIRTTGMNAHAGQSADPLWGEVADFLHISAISAWVGGLVVLTVCLLPRRRLAELEEVVPKFSQVALVSVLMIVSSGLILLWRVVGSLDGFWETHYAHVLVVKLSLFTLVMLAAMTSKRWVEKSLAGAIATRRRTAVRSLVASVAAETALVVTVLGAASVLATSSPGV